MPATFNKLTEYKQRQLSDKLLRMKEFDNKYDKTLEDCYDRDKLSQQLFNFVKEGKNVRH